MEGKLFQFDRLAINVIVENSKGDICSCDIPYSDNIEKFKDDAVRNKELNVILTQIDRIQKNGALERYFRYEGKMSDHVMALPAFQSGLRLYCLRMSDSVLIIGNGGVKDTRTYNEDTELSGYVINLQKLDALLREDIEKGIVVIESTDIHGADDKAYDV